MGIDIFSYKCGIILKRPRHMPFCALWSFPTPCPRAQSLSPWAHQLTLPRSMHLFHWQHCVCLLCHLIWCCKRSCWCVDLRIHWTLAYHRNSQRRFVRAQTLFHSPPKGEEACIKFIPIPIGTHPVSTTRRSQHSVWPTTIMAHPFKEAGINWFDPIKPFKTSAHFLSTDQVLDSHWLSLLELSDDLFPFPWLSDKEQRHYLLGDSISTLSVMYIGPPLSAPTYSTPTIPPLSILTWSIIQSSNKLFFISNSIGTNEAREWQLVQVALQDSCPCTLHASRMAISLLNSTSVILLTCGTMGLTLATCCNITHWVNFNPHYLQWTHILFGCLILQRIMPLNTNYFLFVNGLTWHIKTRSSMARSNWLLSTAKKLEIVSPNQIGMSLKPIVTCSTTHIRALMCHHIQFMSTAEHMRRFTAMPLPVNW